MKEQYTFTVILGNSGDEFSENFNPKDIEQVSLFEEDIQGILEDGNWEVKSVQLVRVETVFDD